MTSVGDFENAVTARLQAASDAGVLGYKYAQLGSYPLNFDEWILQQQVKFPAAWIVWAGWATGDLQGPGSYQLPSRFILVLAAESLRNEVSTRQGSVGQVGSYQLLMDACGLLANHKLGLDINPIRIGAARTLFNPKLQQTRKVNLIALDLLTSLFLEVPQTPFQPGAADPIANFTDFHVDWDIPGWLPVVGPALPADAAAAAVDDVTLPGFGAP